MITTITMNPALDRTIKVGSLTYGEVNRVGRFREDLGGKGINVGRILNGLGMPTMNTAFLGSENQHEIIEYIKKDAMAFDYVAVEGRTRTNIKIVETDKNITTDINEDGIEIGREDYGKFMTKIDGLAKNSEFLIISGSLARGIPDMTYGNITRLYKKHCKVVVDAEGDVLIGALRAEPFMIKPNIHELGEAVGREIESDEEVIEAARDLITEYNVTYVLASMGEKGSILVSKTEAYRAGTLPVEVVSTVGAGDAMVAGFVYAMSRKKTIEECLAFGAACSALTISAEGYPVLDIDDVYDQSRQVAVEKVNEEED